MSARFITGNALNHELEQLFESADRSLILVSPYISLHERYASVLRARLQDDRLAITLVFGKNEEDPGRSMKRDDLDFFIQFPNIEIRYESRLHAKYYANDILAIVTSMNLYRYSQDHNIEAGVLMERITIGADLANKVMGRSDLETDAGQYFSRVVDQAKLIYKNVPTYEKVMMGLTKKYIGSNVVEDQVETFFGTGRIKSQEQKVVARRNISASKETKPLGSTGFCIASGTPIPFNVKRPFSEKAFAKLNSLDDAQHYCHFSGEASNGETSYHKPILWKNWWKAKEIHGL